MSAPFPLPQALAGAAVLSMRGMHHAAVLRTAPVRRFGAGAGPAASPVAWWFIVEVVARRAGYSREEVIGPRRCKALCRARQIAHYLLHNRKRFSLPMIARRMERDHTTVLHSVRVTHARIGSDPAFAREIALVWSIITDLWARRAAALPVRP